MKKLLYTAIAAAILPLAAEAQVEKKVEVTKNYVPSVESAPKLAIVPDMTDTVKMRPDIDYTVTPLSLQTTLATRPIRPATVTYWEFNRPKNFYIKAGAGLPFNSVFDFYAASQNPSTGYVVGYVNHEGRFAKIANDYNVKNNSTEMLNRIGAAAGKYFGKRTLEGALSYENRLYHRYGNYFQPDNELIFSEPGARIDFGDVNASVRFGDDFYDLSRVNFEVAAHGSFFASYPEVNDIFVEQGGDAAPKYSVSEGKYRPRQTTLGAEARVGKAFGRHRLILGLGYEYMCGNEVYSDTDQKQLRASLRYGIDGELVHAEFGADYYNDVAGGLKAANYIIPYARLSFDVGKNVFCPFIELDGGVYDNSARSLSHRNPYAAYNLWMPKSSVDYGGRLGFGGNLWKGKFGYRLYAGVTLHDNRLYWLATSNGLVHTIGDYGRQTEVSFNGEFAWRPVENFRMGLGAHVFLYNDQDTELENGCPNLTGELTARYENRKITIGAGVYTQSVRTWSELNLTYLNVYQTSVACDVRVDFGWKLSQTVTVFAEGRNLANLDLYPYPYMPGSGINFTAGVKLNF